MQSSVLEERPEMDLNDARKFAQFVTCVMTSQLLIHMLCMLAVANFSRSVQNVQRIRSRTIAHHGYRTL